MITRPEMFKKVSLEQGIPLYKENNFFHLLGVYIRSAKFTTTAMVDSVGFVPHVNEEDIRTSAGAALLSPLQGEKDPRIMRFGQSDENKIGLNELELLDILLLLAFHNEPHDSTQMISKPEMLVAEGYHKVLSRFQGVVLKDSNNDRNSRYLVTSPKSTSEFQVTGKMRELLTKKRA